MIASSIFHLLGGSGFFHVVNTNSAGIQATFAAGTWLKANSYIFGRTFDVTSVWI
jgi:hypothetical protein